MMEIWKRIHENMIVIFSLNILDMGVSMFEKILMF